jgi:AraC-like DNA-binding protein
MLGTEAKKPKRVDTVQFHADAVHRVIGAIRERLDDNISLKEMAELAHMSHCHFNRTFRRVTGLPPRRFLSALRVQAATRLLLDTDSTVTDICLEVGYSSLGTFIRRFSGVLGISPMRLRVMQQTPIQSLLRHSQTSSERATDDSAPSLVGRVQAPASFSGPIFIGLFATAIPEGAPLACTIQYSPGHFRIARVRAGRHYVFAVGLKWPDSLDDYFNHEFALRGGGELVCMENGEVDCGEIYLRRALPTDPPILVNLPVLLDKARGLPQVA